MRKNLCKLLILVGVNLLWMPGTSFAVKNIALKNISEQQKIAELEKSSGGKIGIAALNLANNDLIEYRANERFPFQSTFKVVAVATLLKNNNSCLTEKITYQAKDLVFWSPITATHLDTGMTIFDLCSASIRYSDNLATNLILKKIGGLEKVNVFARSLGATSFSLDNFEPNLNSKPNDLQDTCTPQDMRKILQGILVGKILSPSQRAQILDWMKKNTTGDKRIRAGVPTQWVVADKTGGGASYGITNDIGIIFPPKHAPILLVIFLRQDQKNSAQREDVVAQATRLLLAELAQGDPALAISAH